MAEKPDRTLRLAWLSPMIFAVTLVLVIGFFWWLVRA